MSKSQEGTTLDLIEKPAETRAPIHPLLSHRWSPRAFADRPVEPAKMVSLLEAARWASSSNNEQPWYFLVAMRDDEQNFRRTAECLVEFNRAWAQHAAALLLTVTHTKSSKTGKPNPWATYDLGQAAANLVIQATDLGLATHQMAGLDRDKAREIFFVPEDYEVMTALAIGYRGEANSLQEPLKSREIASRTRKPLEEFVFSGRWGTISPLVTGN